MEVSIMEIEQIKITDLKPATYNPRRISEEEYKKLKNSISTFGLVDPIIVNLKNMHIVGGHQRYDALCDMNMEDNEFLAELSLIRMGDVGFVFSDTDLSIEDEDHEKALNLALNKISGEWDNDKLEVLLEELELSPIDIELTGFSEPELEELDIETTSDTPTEQEVVEDEYKEPEDIETSIQHGDLFKLGNHYLLCGDATLEEDVKTLLSGGGSKIDLLFTDPPYGINIVNTTNEVETSSKLGFDKKGTVGTPGIVKARKYKPIINDDKPFDPEPLLKLNVDSIIWGANNFSSKLPDSPRWLVWYKKPFDKQNNNNFSDVELAWTNLPGKVCKLYHYLWSGLLREGNRELELKERVHPTQKPVGLLSNILNDFSNPNDTVLDLFGGSGSTLIACEQTNRNCYMMELDPYYCQVIINRWEEYTGQKANKIN